MHATDYYKWWLGRGGRQDGASGNTLWLDRTAMATATQGGTRKTNRITWRATGVDHMLQFNWDSATPALAAVDRPGNRSTSEDPRVWPRPTGQPPPRDQACGAAGADRSGARSRAAHGAPGRVRPRVSGHPSRIMSPARHHPPPTAPTCSDAIGAGALATHHVPRLHGRRGLSLLYTPVYDRICPRYSTHTYGGEEHESIFAAPHLCFLFTYSELHNELSF
jgi:hypothetical protein